MDADTPIAPRVAHLEGLADLASKRELVDEDIRRRVRLARWSGARWADIGEALGVTAQAAQQRYRGESTRDRGHA